MTEPGENVITRLERLPTGVPGLDAILRGGFFRAGLYIIQGEPGTGKTIFGNQLCFAHVAAGGQALYITLLAESHHRMLSHIRDLTFVEPERIGRDIHYLSAFKTLEQEGLHGLLTLVRREVVSRKVTLLILDGLVQAGETAGTTTEFKKFINGLQLQASLTDCTMFLLTSGGKERLAPEHTMVDGLLQFADHHEGWIATRDLTIRKFRGSAFLRGRHSFRIADEGLRMYPRLESLYDVPSRIDSAERTRVSTGVAGIDAILGGGLPQGSCTLVLGPTGSGKTTLGLHLLAKSSADEPGLLFGFYETPAQIKRKAASLVPDLHALIETGQVTLRWQPGTERLIDEIGHEIIDLVRERNIKRLVVDGLGGFERLAAEASRTPSFFTALSNELRAQGVTSMFTLEVADLVGPVARAPQNDLTQLADSLVLLRFAEANAWLHRLISVFKVRDSDFDHTVREFVIAPGGIAILEGFESADTGPGGLRLRNREAGTGSKPGREDHGI